MNTLLIANRGEIALRVMRTARRLGWSTVAIHTDLDAGAPHVRAADRTVRVGSYLDVDEVVAAARESGAGFVQALACCAAYRTLHAQAQFVNVKRLDDVIIRTQFQPSDFAGAFVALREEDRGDVFG